MLLMRLAAQLHIVVFGIGTDMLLPRNASVIDYLSELSIILYYSQSVYSAERSS